MSSDAVVHRPEQRRYELMRGQERLGLVDYSPRGDDLAILHTEINPEHRNQGLAEVLVRGMFDDLRTQGKRAVPLCPYIHVFLRRHPEYRDVATE